MTLTDTHCHLDLDQFAPDRQAVLDRALQAGVDHLLLPALDLASSRSVVALAATHPALFAAIGVHPTESASWELSTRAALQAIFSADAPGTAKIVAIGEIGLDYYWDTAPHPLQQAVLREQLDLAAALGLPVILHFREAKGIPSGPCAADLLVILNQWCAGLISSASPLANHPGVLHSFAGTLETAQEAIRLGFYIGITGPVTYGSRRRQELVAALPLERLLIETDAPFQAPTPHQGNRNEPAFVSLIADKIAMLHARPVADIAAITSENAKGLFNWKQAA